MFYYLTQYCINNALKTHRNSFFVFLTIKIFNCTERYTLFALYGSTLCAQHFGSKSLRSNTLCAPHFAHTLRPTLCAPQFAPHTLHPTLCTSKLCAPVFCAITFCFANTFCYKTAMKYSIYI